MLRESKKRSAAASHNFLKDRSLSEPDFFDKSAGFYSDRFKTQNLPSEYICVDDLHYYRRRKPNLFESKIDLFNKSEPSIPFASIRSEYGKSFQGRQSDGTRPSLFKAVPTYLRVDADPFLTGATSYKSEPSLPYLPYETEYEHCYHPRPPSPRLCALRRPTTLKLVSGTMDGYSESQRQFRPYSEHDILTSRPKLIIHPDNLKLSGNIELFPEYRTKYVHYDIDKIVKSNNSKAINSYYKMIDNNSLQNAISTSLVTKKPPTLQPSTSRVQKEIEDAHSRNSNRFYRKMDGEKNNYMPEYRSKYQVPLQFEKRASMPQGSHFIKHSGDLKAQGSEYSDRFRTYDHFTKSAPIKKSDHLRQMNHKGVYEPRPEYKDRYKQIDLKTFEKNGPFKHQDNLRMDGEFPKQVPEYNDQYRDHQTMPPNRAKPKQDYMHLSTEPMEYNPEYAGEYTDFPRSRPIVTKPISNIKLSSSNQNYDGKNKATLPIITLADHQNASPRHRKSRIDGIVDEIPLSERPEYRKAVKNYLIKERSPSREPSGAQTPDIQISGTDKRNNKENNNVQHGAQRVFNEPKISFAPDENNNEAIIEPLKPPDNFKIALRSSIQHSPGRGPTYPIPTDHRYVSRSPERYDSPTVRRQIRNPGRRSSPGFKAKIEDYDSDRYRQKVEPRYQQYNEEDNSQLDQTTNQSPQRLQESRSPRFGRRAPHPVENYNIRTRSNVIEGNPNYVREHQKDIQPNRQQQTAYHQPPQQHYQQDLNHVPTNTQQREVYRNRKRIEDNDSRESLQTQYQQEYQKPSFRQRGQAVQSIEPQEEYNFRPNYEIDKQTQYRQSLDDTAFVVLNHTQQKQKSQPCKPNAWMKPSWFES